MEPRVPGLRGASRSREATRWAGAPPPAAASEAKAHGARGSVCGQCALHEGMMDTRSSPVTRTDPPSQSPVPLE